MGLKKFLKDFILLLHRNPYKIPAGSFIVVRICIECLKIQLFDGLHHLLCRFPGRIRSCVCILRASRTGGQKNRNPKNYGYYLSFLILCPAI